MKKILYGIASGFMSVLTFFQHLHADFNGKFDTGPTYISIDVLKSGKTERRLNMFGWKADFLTYHPTGAVLKTCFLGGRGQKAYFYSGSTALGWCFPLYEHIKLTPNAGITVGTFSSLIEIPIPVQIPCTNLWCNIWWRARERMKILSPFVALDFTFCLYEDLRICGMVQYVWSRVHNVIGKTFTIKNRTEGFNYSVMLEKDLNKCLSVNLGYGYNESLSKEKHGLRGYGLKLGLAYWY